MNKERAIETFKAQLEYEGMTNREVIQALFPNADIRTDDGDYCPSEYVILNVPFSRPYQKGE